MQFTVYDLVARDHIDDLRREARQAQQARAAKARRHRIRSTRRSR